MTEPTSDPPIQPSPSKPLKQRLADMLAEYGKVGLVIYFSISIATIIGFCIAFGLGLEPSDATGVIGVIVAGWIAGKATIFIRIPICLAITPPIAELLKRRRQRRIAAGLELSDAQIAALDAQDDA
jgi:hypothetical protein